MVKFKVEYDIKHDIAFNEGIIDLKGYGYDVKEQKYTDTCMPFHSNFIVHNYHPSRIRFNVRSRVSDSDLIQNDISEDLYRYTAISSISTYMANACYPDENGNKWVFILIRHRNSDDDAKFRCYFEEVTDPDKLDLVDIVLDYADKFNIDCSDVSAAYTLMDKYNKNDVLTILDNSFAYGRNRCKIEVDRVEPVSYQIIKNEGCHGIKFNNQTLYCALV